MEHLNYTLKDGCDYVVRWSSHINEDLERGWSSWNYGLDGFDGTKEELLSKIEEYNVSGGEFQLSGFNIWIDESISIKSSTDVYINKEWHIAELYKNYWVVVDDLNAKGELSCWYLPAMDSLNDLLAEIKENEIDYKPYGDGESFNARNARVIYSDDINGMHIIEISYE